MRIALAQMEVVAGNPDGNLETMLWMIEEAKWQGAELVVFPELCVSGYILSDLWTNEAFCKRLMSYNETLCRASKGIALAYGNIFVDDMVERRWNDSGVHPNKDGRHRKYNAVYVYQDGQPAKRIIDTAILPEGIQPKTLLPNYRIFDDSRYFFSLEDIALDAGQSIESMAHPFIIQAGKTTLRIGFEVCEDLWIRDYRRSGLPFNISKLLIQNGAELLINISSSPWNEGKNASRDRRIRFLKEESGDQFVSFLYVNKVGAENNGKNIITFDGGTTVYNGNGKAVRLTRKSYEPEVLICDSGKVNSEPEVNREEPPAIEQKFNAIIKGIKHMRSFVPDPLRFVIGLSGGIDSAVAASLLTHACGKENVVAINMPTRYNTDRTRNTARSVADHLGISYHVVPVEELSVLNGELFRELDSLYAKSDHLLSLSDENIQAKLRGTAILSNFAGRYGYLMSANGNKLEIALGYATLYGDVNGSIAPLGDLTKTEVYALARYLNARVFQKEIIPSILIPDELYRFGEDQIKPSPELKEDQINPMKFGYHCALLTAATDYLRKTPDDLMRWYLEGRVEVQLGIPEGMMERWGLDSPQVFLNDLEWFFNTLRKNVFKRIQAPPIVITSKSAFGYDFRESMIPGPVSVDNDLKKQVLRLTRYIRQ